MAKKGKKKKKAKQEYKKSEKIFVRLSNPDFLAVDLLEARKKVLESKKLFKEIRDIRTRKDAEKKVLSKSMKQIAFLINRIKATIPTVDIPKENLKANASKSVPKKAQKKPKQQVEQPRSKTDLDRIEDSLAEIEKKLAKLT